MRKLQKDDLYRTHEWLHRPDIQSKIGVKTPFTLEQQERWFEKLQQDASKIVFALCLRKEGSHIGNVSLDMIDPRHSNARLSIFLAEQSARGKGYGTEAMELLQQYAFTVLKLHKIWCKTDVDDPTVLSFYEKLGFSREGVWREHEFKNGKFVDKVLFGKINK